MAKSNPYRQEKNMHWLASAMTRQRVARTLLLCLLIYPFLLMSLGMIADKSVHGRVFFFHSQALLVMGYALAPFLIIFELWPRETDSKKPSKTQITYDIVRSLTFLVLLNMFVEHSLATADPQSFYLNRAAKHLLNKERWESIDNIPEFWNYLKTDIVDSFFTPPTHCNLPNASELYNGPGYTSTCNMFRTADITVRQVRVDPIQCSGNFPTSYTCAPPYTENSESRSLFGSPKEKMESYGYNTLDAYAAGLDTAVQKFIVQVNAEQNENWGNSSGNNGTSASLLSGNWSQQYFDAPFNNVQTTATQLAFYWRSGSYIKLNGKMTNPLAQFGPTRTTHFPGDGYFFQWPSTLPVAEAWLKSIDELKNGNWFDINTRLVEISIVLTCPGLDKWLVIILKLEQTAGGDISTDSSFVLGLMDSDANERGSNKRSELNFNQWRAFYIHVMSLTMLFLFTIPSRIVDHGIKLTSVAASRPFLFFDFFVAVIIIGSWSCKLAADGYWPSDDQNGAPYIAENGQRFWLFISTTVFDYRNVKTLWVWSRDLIGCAAIFAWFRLLQFLMWIPGIGVVPRAMLNALASVGVFVIALFVIASGFVTGFYIVYSADEFEFSSGSRTFVTLWSALLGNIEVDLFTSHYYLGVSLYVFFSFLTLFVFLTMLISVIDNAYSTATEEEEEFTEKFETAQKREVHRNESKLTGTWLWKIRAWYHMVNKLDKDDDDDDHETLQETRFNARLPSPKSKVLQDPDIELTNLGTGT
eukprot:m.341624 g.341624  ORF g.341624 m.341624 type:complete len:755 (-) comp20282_c0_seq1:77-2341(-)